MMMMGRKPWAALLLSFWLLTPAFAETVWLDGALQPVEREQAKVRGEIEADEQGGWYLKVYDLENDRLRQETALDSGDIAVAKFVGPYRSYHPNGKVRTIGERDERGRFTGLREQFTDDGARAARIDMHDGQRHGDDVRYRTDGKTAKSVTPFVRGKAHGVYRHFHEDGESVLRTATFLDGQIRGVLSTFYPNGNVAREVEYRNGKPNGTALSYGANGSITREQTRVDGEIVGPSRYWLSDGTLYRATMHTEDGKLVSDTRYHKNGEPKRVQTTEEIDGQTMRVLRTYTEDGKLAQHNIASRDRKQRWTREYDEEGNLIANNRVVDGRLEGLVRRQGGPGNYTVSHYAEGRRHGEFAEYRGGELFEHGSYHRGRRTGRWERTSGDEVRVSEYDDQGKHHGEVSITVAGEVRQMRTFRHGAQHGPFERRDDEGVLIERGLYVDDKRSGPWVMAQHTAHLSAGKRRQISKGEFRDGKRIGTWEVRLAEGYLMHRGNFDDEGRQHGANYWFAENGRLLQHSEFRHGKRHGHHIEFELDGTRKDELVFEDNKIVEDRMPH